MRFPRSVGRWSALACTLAAWCLAWPAHAADFTVSSPEFASGGQMPVTTTCDGGGVAPVIQWSAPPRGTKSLVLLMETEPGPPRPGEVQTGGGDYSWTIFDIPATTRSTKARTSGRIGHNSHNPSLAYAPPCSQGPGEHTYTITVLALSRKLGLAPGGVTGDVLKVAAAPITLASASIEGKVTRG